MKIRNMTLLLLGTLLFFSACKEEKTKTNQEEEASVEETRDWHSNANAMEINPEHLDLVIEVDFDQKQIKGEATWHIQPEDGVEEAVFDTQGMDIEKVMYDDGTEADFKMGETDSVLGTPIHIPVNKETKSLTLIYTTGQEATALQWLEPSQTFGGKQPYLYTQGEPIYGRTWIPGPDGPGYRFTFTAEVKVPEGLMALMSSENPTEIQEDGVYTFEMKEKIPLYLLALAVGDIQFKAVDERTGVYAEPAILEKAYQEMDGNGEMLNIAEKIYGKYRWGQFDVLILPSGFPMGGMENPRLTFATPTILAGDKSLTNLIAHELAHSWSGNLVTNASWEDLWLNEGFTVYFERRITEAQHDAEYAAMLWDLAEKKVDKAIERVPERQTWLKGELKDEDPEMAFTRIPYDKGAAFLLHIEQTVGRENWDTFLNKYFEDHAFLSMTTEKFLDYLDKHLLSKNDEWKEKVNPKEWVYGPGKPNSYPKVDNPRFQHVDKVTQTFVDGTSASDMETADWSTYEWLRFFEKLPDDLDYDQLEELDGEFDFTHSQNSEIANAWFIQSLKSDYTPAYEQMKEFLYVTGRAKFLEPLYEEMVKTEEGQKMADEIYKKAKPNYHPITQKAIDKILD